MVEPEPDPSPDQSSGHSTGAEANGGGGGGALTVDGPGLARLGQLLVAAVNWEAYRAFMSLYGARHPELGLQLVMQVGRERKMGGEEVGVRKGSRRRRRTLGRGRLECPFWPMPQAHAGGAGGLRCLYLFTKNAEASREGGVGSRRVGWRGGEGGEPGGQWVCGGRVGG